MLYLCRFKPLRDHLRGFLIAAWAGDKIAEFSFPEISFHFPLRPWFFFVSPAYAGKSGISPGFLLSYRDHPRVCGEKESVNDGTAIRAGSPPRMRGKARSCQANTSVTRITPAYAGKSSNVPSAFRCGRDHPRVCGEKAFVRSCCASRTGSPPRMRGKEEKRRKQWNTSRITPAYAGKSTGSVGRHRNR